MCSDGERDVLLHGAERTSNITPSGHTVTARLSCTRTPTHPSQTMPSLVTMSRSSTPRVPRRARSRAERERYVPSPMMVMRQHCLIVAFLMSALWEARRLK